MPETPGQVTYVAKGDTSSGAAQGRGACHVPFAWGTLGRIVGPWLLLEEPAAQVSGQEEGTVIITEHLPG